MVTHTRICTWIKLMVLKKKVKRTWFANWENLFLDWSKILGSTWNLLTLFALLVSKKMLLNSAFIWRIVGVSLLFLSKALTWWWIFSFHGLFSSGWCLPSPLLLYLPQQLHGWKSPLKDLIEAQRSSLHRSFSSKLPSKIFCGKDWSSCVYLYTWFSCMVLHILCLCANLWRHARIGVSSLG